MDWYTELALGTRWGQGEELRERIEALQDAAESIYKLFRFNLRHRDSNLFWLCGVAWVCFGGSRITILFQVFCTACFWSQLESGEVTFHQANRQTLFPCHAGDIHERERSAGDVTNLQREIAGRLRGCQDLNIWKPSNSWLVTYHYHSGRWIGTTCAMTSRNWKSCLSYLAVLLSFLNVLLYFQNCPARQGRAWNQWKRAERGWRRGQEEAGHGKDWEVSLKIVALSKINLWMIIVCLQVLQLSNFGIQTI